MTSQAGATSADPAVADPDVRAEFTMALRARTALHLGAAAGELAADLALARDGLGRCYLPGTSWGGVLRRLAARLFDEARAARVFGPPAGADPGYASRVVVDDTQVDDASVELRTGVGIDRVTGTAADRIRYDREVLAPGSAVTLRLRYEGPWDDSVELLRRLVAAVRADGIRIGAGTRRGLGLHCEHAQERIVDLRSRAALLDEIAGTTPVTAVPPDTAALGTLRILLSWRTARPVLAGGAPGGTPRMWCR